IARSANIVQSWTLPQMQTVTPGLITGATSFQFVEFDFNNVFVPVGKQFFVAVVLISRTGPPTVPVLSSSNPVPFPRIATMTYHKINGNFLTSGNWTGAWAEINGPCSQSNPSCGAGLNSVTYTAQSHVIFKLYGFPQ